VWGRRWQPQGWWSPESDPGRGLPLSLVLLHPNRVPADVVSQLARLGPVHLVRGSPSDADALAEANAKDAKCLLYLASTRRPERTIDEAGDQGFGATSRGAVLADAEGLLTCYGMGENSGGGGSPPSMASAGRLGNSWDGDELSGSASMSSTGSTDLDREFAALGGGDSGARVRAASAAAAQIAWHTGTGGRVAGWLQQGLGLSSSPSDPARLPPPPSVLPSAAEALAAAAGLARAAGAGARNASLLLQGTVAHIPAHAIVELTFTSSIRFLQPGLLLSGASIFDFGHCEVKRGQGAPRKSWTQRELAEEAAAAEGLAQWQTNIYYAAGRVMVPAHMDTWICQAFHKKRLLEDFMSELCGDDGVAPGGSLLNQLPVRIAGRP
jgi:hypothetical protein